jgi:hypothetical protein
VIDDARLARDQTVAHSMESLKIELLFALQWNKTHIRSLYPLSNSFCVQVVILLDFRNGFTNCAGYQANVMGVTGKHTAQIVRSATSLHSDQAGLEVCSKGKKLIP